MPRISLVMSIGGLVAAAWLAGTGPLAAQTGPALAGQILTGKVTAGQEALEGVLVGANETDRPSRSPS